MCFSRGPPSKHRNLLRARSLTSDPDPCYTTLSPGDAVVGNSQLLIRPFFQS